MLAAVLLWSSAAAAQDRPASLPTRDVDVTYRVGQGGQTVEQRSRFDVGAQRLRLDTPTPGFYMIVDYRAHTMLAVSEADRGVLDLPAPPSAVPGATPGTAPGGGFVRRGQDQVAGLPCTEWETTDTGGRATLACFTADGVMLRARHGPQVIAVATRVAYGPIDPAVFVVPPDYNRVERRPPR